MSFMRFAYLAAAAGAAAMATVAVSAKVNMAPVAPAKAKAVMAERHDGMERIGKLMKQLARDTKSDPMNMTAVKANAAAMNILSQRAANWFPAGTGPEAGKHGAKAEIWKNQKDFAVKIAQWQAASANLHQAAQSGNGAAIGAALGKLGDSCKACHDLYRSKHH